MIYLNFEKIRKGAFSFVGYLSKRGTIKKLYYIISRLKFNFVFAGHKEYKHFSV